MLACRNFAVLQRIIQFNVRESCRVESIIPADAFGYNLILHSGGEGEEAASGLNLVRVGGAVPAFNFQSRGGEDGD